MNNTPLHTARGVWTSFTLRPRSFRALKNSSLSIPARETLLQLSVSRLVHNVVAYDSSYSPVCRPPAFQEQVRVRKRWATRQEFKVETDNPDRKAPESGPLSCTTRRKSKRTKVFTIRAKKPTRWHQDRSDVTLFPDFGPNMSGWQACFRISKPSSGPSKHL